MGSHRTQDEKLELGERARELRAAGRSRREIHAELGIGDDLGKELLRGVALPDSLARLRAKDDLRAIAVDMRLAGRTYDDIAVEPNPCATPPRSPAESDAGLCTTSELDSREAARGLRAEGLLLKEIAERVGISIKTASLYPRGMSWPSRSRHGGDAEHVRAMSEARWGPYRRERDAAAHQRKLDAANAVGEVEDRTLLLLGAVAYWCEATKSKPWRRRSSFVFMNSDPILLRLFVRWLRLVHVPPERWIVSVHLHETSDVADAERWWRHVLGVDDLSFGKAVIKRHKPLTKRRSIGADYLSRLPQHLRP